MDEMRIRDYDDFRSPNRKPWLLVILAILVVIAVMQLRNSPIDKADGGSVIKASEQTQEAVDLGTTPPGVVAKPVSGSDVNAVLVTARDMVQKTSLVPARLKYLEILNMDLNQQVRAEVENELGKVNVVLATTPLPWPDCKVTYVVQTGDSVQEIAKKHGTTIDLIKKANGLKDVNLIKKGDLFRILKGIFRIEVSKSRNDLVLYMNDTFFKRYRVGTGKYGKTPVGECIIDDKQKEPVWWRPDGTQVPFTGDPKGENILGTRWMSLKYTAVGAEYGGYGIHGTWDNESIGKSESAGCIRMHNSDVEELYMFVPVGTKVTIIE